MTDRSQLPQLAQVWRGAGHVAGAAAAIVCLGPVLDDERQQAWLQYDHGQATMSMAIAAADLGIGSSHAAVADQALARRLLGFPEDRFAVSLLSLGYPADRPLVPLKRPTAARSKKSSTAGAGSRSSQAVSRLRHRGSDPAWRARPQLVVNAERVAAAVSRRAGRIPPRIPPPPPCRTRAVPRRRRGPAGRSASPGPRS